jgi:aspartate carbamoyltransferase regulatory subunit
MKVVKMLKVGKIQNGVVIDHIPAKKALRCLALMGSDFDDSTILALNVSSSKFGKKDILKMENVFPDEEVLNKIALIAPGATINYIKNSTVTEKKKVEYPKEITGTVKCINPRCATNTEKYLTPKFGVIGADPLILKCNYCERHMTEEDVVNQLK